MHNKQRLTTPAPPATLERGREKKIKLQSKERRKNDISLVLIAPPRSELVQAVDS